ncbi:hypothetical protein [Gandjariella thermophila]|uniref:Uncharacterized protein n=1 Tax=Gandjariella thermophila TaxID=1931992 RepID=A0A4D4J045_9PSEU|nr:hypothetical protein [Gandjariella thermophila]GDY28724.1 hypothetical protein GTS_03570 [Gandjariella thermophila]
MPTSSTPRPFPTRIRRRGSAGPSRPRWMYRAAAILAIPAAVLVGFAPPALADEPSNIVVAVNATVAGQSMSRFGWDIESVTGAEAVARNAAVAISVGRGARTIAMAWQILLASDIRDRVAPEEVARTDSRNCVSCDTTAIAYQFTVASNGPVQLAPRSRARLAQLRDRAAALSRSTEPTPVIIARADAIARELSDVLSPGVEWPRSAARSGGSAPGVVVRRVVDHR